MSFSVTSLAKAYGDAPFAKTPNGLCLYSEVAENVGHLSTLLIQKYSKKSTALRVGASAENTLVAIFSLLACLEADITVVLLHPRWSNEERRQAIETYDIRYLLQTDGSLIETGQPGERLHHPECAVIITSSGSTGRPKGVMLSKENFVAAAKGSAANLGWRKQDCWWAGLPVCHVGGLSIVIRCLLAGKPLRLRDGFDPATFISDVEDGDTLASLTPTMLYRIRAQYADWRPPASLRAILLGGAPARCEDLVGARNAGFPVLATYGSTETCAQATTQRPDVPLNQCDSGKALDGVALRLRNGALELKGAQVMLGYFPEAGQPFTADGWYRTGDLGSLDDKGNLTLHGRADGVMITGGEKVHPEEVQRLLEGHPEITSAYVFGQPDADWGERVVAAVEAPSGGPREKLTGQLQERLASLASYKRPKELALLAKFPRNEMGKLLRRETETLAIKQIAQNARERKLHPIIEALVENCPPSLVNQYITNFPGETDGAQIRLANVTAYLRRLSDHLVLFVSQAPGAGGARWSGVPLTTTEMLAAGRLGPGYSWTRRATEASSEAVHAGIGNHHDQVMLWSTVPWHPQGATFELSRKPTPEEIAAGVQVLALVAELCDWRGVASIGAVADKALSELGVEHTLLPHPYYDGPEECASAITRYLESLKL